MPLGHPWNAGMAQAQGSERLVPVGDGFNGGYAPKHSFEHKGCSTCDITTHGDR
jgi:hypothetical protein